MSSTLKLSLRANEKLYINGAVVRADRKVTIELLNDVQFLLESHVIQAEDASTPLKQLYFIVQVMLMNPQGASGALAMFRRSLALLLANFNDAQVLNSLKHIDRLVNEGQIYEALKAIRSLYPLERRILEGESARTEKPRPLAAGAR
jgi:flagellar protein FlbT